MVKIQFNKLWFTSLSVFLSVLVLVFTMLGFTTTASASTVLYSQDTANSITSYANVGADVFLHSTNSNYITIDLPSNQLLHNSGYYLNDFYLAFSGQTSGTEVLTLSVTCYYTSAFTTTCGSSSATSSLGAPRSYSNNAIQFTLANPTAIIASSTAYYRLTVSTNNAGVYPYVAFPVYNNLSSGLNWRTHGAFYSPTPYQLASYGTPYLVITSNDQGTNFSEIRDISLPQNDTVTPISTRFYYTWWNADDGYSQSGVRVTDITTPQSVYTPQVSSISTGLNTFDQYVNLTDNHLYQWKPYIYNPTTQSYIYGSNYRFSVGTQQSPFINLDTSDVSGLDATSTSLINELAHGFNLGTTTDPTQVGFQAVAGGADKLRLKVPFDYLADMFVLLQDFNDGYNAGTTEVLTWHYENGNASTTLIIMSPDAIEANTLITLLRNTIAMFIYVVWTLTVPKFVAKLL